MERARKLKREMLLACSLFAAGVLVSGLSLLGVNAESEQHAQATPPLRGTQQPDDQDKPPAEAKPGGERPTTPAPEPAQPDPQTQGAAKPALKPALPPAPAEKFAPPVKDKQGSN